VALFFPTRAKQATGLIANEASGPPGDLANRAPSSQQKRELSQGLSSYPIITSISMIPHFLITRSVRARLLLVEGGDIQSIEGPVNVRRMGFENEPVFAKATSIWFPERMVN